MCNITLLFFFNRKANSFLERNRYSIKIFFVIFIVVAFLSGPGSYVYVREKESSKLDAFPFYKWEFDQYLMLLSPRLDYPVKNESIPELKNKKNVLFILVDSYRHDIMNRKLSPNIIRFGETHSCLRSRNHCSSSHLTEFGVFSYLSGLHSYYLAFFANSKTKPFSFEILRKNGYVLYGVTASGLFNFDKQLREILKNFDIYREFLGDDLAVIDWVKETYQCHDKTTPFFFFVFFYATHYNYHYPPQFEKYTPAPEVECHNLSSRDSERYQGMVVNRYKNSVLYVDSLFVRLMNVFKEEIENNNLVVVVTGDHGEEFWESGFFGHARSDFSNAQVKTPLLFFMPGIEDKEVNLSCHEDIFPTLVYYLNPSIPLNYEEFFSGKSLFEKDESRYLILCGHHFPYRNKHVCLVTDDGKLLLKKNNYTIDILNNFSTIKTTDLNDNIIATKHESFDKALGNFRKDLGRFFNKE